MFKVMTLNLNYYGEKHGPWPARRALIRDLIAAYEPDVVALQAVCSDPAVEGGADQVAQLARSLPQYQYTVFQPAEEQAGAVSHGSGFLSCIEMAETDYMELTLRPGLEDTNQRVLLHATFDLPGGRLNLFNAHFSWVYDQAADNLAQAIPYINSFAGAGLLVGDMNQTAGVDLVGQLAAAGWTDVWASLRPDEDGPTFESYNPAIRIDYVWANGGMAPCARAIAVLGREEETGNVRLSDHLALMATFDVETWRE